RTRFFADLQQLVTDLLDGLLPADALPAAVDQLHRILGAARAVAVVAQRGALGAVSAQVDGAVESRLLTDPDAVLHFGVGAAAHRAVGANGLDALDFGLRIDAASRLGLLDHGGRQGTGDRSSTDGTPGALQEGAAANGPAQYAGAAAGRGGPALLD